MANAFHAGGLVVGFLTVCGEISKVAVPIGIAAYVFAGSLNATLLLILATFLGTNFSPFLRGKGGLGATIELWTLLIFAPYSLVTLGAIFFASYLITKKTYYAVIVTQIFLPFVLFYFERTAAWVVFGAVILMVFLLKYRKERDDFSYWTWSKRGIERKRP